MRKKVRTNRPNSDGIARRIRRAMKESMHRVRAITLTSPRGPSEAREPGVHEHRPSSSARPGVHGFRARRFAAPRNDDGSDCTRSIHQLDPAHLAARADRREAEVLDAVAHA